LLKSLLQLPVPAKLWKIPPACLDRIVHMVVTPDLPGAVQSVSQFNRRVARQLQDHFGVQQVRGELSALTRAASGHWYFTLKDASAQVRCVMFRGRNSQLDFSPREGDELIITAVVNLYEPRGDFQLTVESMRRAGAGLLWEQFLRLRKRLGDEGLFDQDQKRPVPRMPQRVGVITSLRAAALRDVVATLGRRAPSLRIVVYPVPVQGSEAAPAIAAMLDRANQRNEVDVLLLVRGGGSIEDLWAFNEEVVARALRRGHLPVISGVGHESDVTIADFAADVRAPTPTAAAELVAPDWRTQLAAVQALGARLSRTVRHAMDQRAVRLDHARRLLASPRGVLGGLADRLHDRQRRCRLALRMTWRESNEQVLRGQQHLQRAMALRLRDQQHRLAQASRALSHLNVQNVLDRGFAILRHESSGMLIRDSKNLESGKVIEAQLARDRLQLQFVQVVPPQDPDSA
jgi:exodeoxyribonuclease VII large subunit